MKRLAFPALAIALFCAAIFPASADERILSFDSRIEILEDGAIDVTETIRVRAEGQQINRGIFRDLPVLYKGRWGLKEAKPFRVLETTRDGKPEPHVVEKYQAGIRIRIGQASHLLETGEYTYTIRYRSEGQLLFHDDFDELYWNATGNEWAFPIDTSSVTVVLPGSLEVRSAEGYIGSPGSKESSGPARISGSEAVINTDRVLAPGEGLTISVTWPHGFLNPDTYERNIGSLLKQNLLALGGLLLFVAMIFWHVVAWVLVGRDPRAGVVIPQFSPPPGFSPGAVRMLDRMKFDNECFGAAVMGLGVKGVLRIQEKNKSITLEKTGKPPSEPLSSDESHLLTKLFGSKKSIALKQSNHKTLSGARTSLRSSLGSKLEKSHFLGNAGYWVPGFVISLLAVLLLLLNSDEKAGAMFMVFWLSIWSVGTGALISSAVSQFRGGSRLAGFGSSLFAIPFVIGWVGGMFALYMMVGPLASGAFLLTVVINVLFYHLVKAPTHLGRKVLDHIDGLRQYLSVAEADRLAGFSGPERTPELFEKLLPYAHALGVEQKWSEQFTEILARAGRDDTGESGYRPSYFSGTHTGLDRAMGAAALGGALTSALSSASASPSSSGGSSGGGSSGGGGGGGGGGGW